MSLNEKVILICKEGRKREFNFQHALNLLRIDTKGNFKPVGKHKFVNNELIIDTSFGGGEKPTKPTASKKGKGVSERTADTD